MKDTFDAPGLLAMENSSSIDSNPSVSADGLTLWFESNRLASYHLYVATRPSALADFGPPSRASVVNATDEAFDGQPFLAADGSELWLVSNRTPNIGGGDLWRARWTGTGFAVPEMVPELSSGANEAFPALSADRRTICFASMRTAAGAKGGYDIWRSTRSSVDDGFPAPVLVDELNTGGDDFVGWISADGCRLYGTSSALVRSWPPGSAEHGRDDDRARVGRANEGAP